MLRFRPWCWRSVKYSQTICILIKVSSKWKVPFFLLYYRVLKKNCQFRQYFVSRTSCPKTKHSHKVEVAHVNVAGMEFFQLSFGNYFFPHAIHCYYFYTKTHQQAFKAQTWTKMLWFHNGGKFWLTRSNILSDLHFAQNFASMQMFPFCLGTRKNISTHGKIWFTLILWVLPGAGSLPGSPAQARSRQGFGTAHCNSHHWISTPCKTTNIALTASTKGEFIKAGRSDQNAWSTTEMARPER